MCGPEENFSCSSPGITPSLVCFTNLKKKERNAFRFTKVRTRNSQTTLTQAKVRFSKVKKSKLVAGEMVEQLEMLTGLAEDPRPVPSMHVR